MQEGAGTTAYDGSGNGNHGTISGATWTHGIGAPVSQTAVIDWNKGSNLAAYSEQFDNAYWGKSGTTIVANQIAAPNGTLTADKSIVSATNQYHDSLSRSVSTTIGVVYETSIFAKKGVGINGIYYYQGNGSRVAKWNLNNGSYVGHAPTDGYNAFDSYGSETLANGWYRFWARYTASGTTGNFTIGIMPTADNRVIQYAGNGTDFLYLWGASYHPVSSGDSYIPTFATAQTADVLLPQGLTSGRDITGVNLFENVRKQGALNLDGNSWAEVHDNASLDITDAVSLEAWVKLNETPVNTDSGILSKYSSSSFLFTYREVSGQTGFACYIYGSGGLVSSYATNSQINVGEYYHAVGVYDGGNSITTYLNGVQVSQNTTSIPSSMTTNALDVEIGKWDTNKITNASIAQPRIYNRALTAEEVQRSYDSGKNIFTNS